MNTTSAIDRSNTAARESVLRAKLEELSRSFEDRSELAVDTSADPLDVIRASTDRDIRVQTLNMNSRTIAEVRKAITAIDAGVYGTCEDCEEPISARRLAAIPWACFCVKCQELRDQAEPDTDDYRFSLAA
jgi:DnaK suppressor protein